MLAEGMRGMPGVAVVAQHTNMVFIDVAATDLAALRAHMEAACIRLSIGYTPRVRLVTHLDVDDADIVRTIEAFRRFAA
jgi:threonine aldolase